MDVITQNWGVRGTRTILAGEGTVARFAAQWLAQQIREGLRTRKTFHLVLAGGHTPALCYRWLAQEPLDWDRVMLSLSDERCLPMGHSERNDTLIRRNLLRGDARAAHFIAIHGELGPDQAARDHALRWHELGPIDLALLGLGEDGHTASLFPGNPALLVNDGPVVAVRGAPKPPPERVSLSLSALQAARERVFLVTGDTKRDALDQLEQGALLPALQVGPSRWIIEQNALPASQKPRR